MKTVTKTSKIVGGHIPELSDIHSNTEAIVIEDEFDCYLPILSGFSRVMDFELRLMNMESHRESIYTHNKNRNDRWLSDQKVRETKIDVTRNDLSLGPERIILNFTDRPLTVGDRGEMRKTYAPIYNEKLSQFAGKILILEVHALNTPDFINEMSGVDDYLTVLTSELKLVDDPNRVVKMLDIYTYARKLYHKAMREYNEFRSNSIKVISLLAIEGRDVADLNNRDRLYIQEYDLVLSREDITQVSFQEIIKKCEINNFGELFNNNSFICYINDPEDRIGNRYISVGGKACRVPKVSLPEQVEGLHVKFKSDGEIFEEAVVPLDELDKNGLVYKSREEANEGIDVIEKQKQENIKLLEENKLLRLQVERDLLEVKRDHDLELNKISREHEEYKLKAEREKEEFKLKVEKEREEYKNKLDREKDERERLTMAEDYYSKREMNTMKHVQETNKTSSEKSLSQLKVVAGVATFLVGAIALYKKLG